MENVELSQYPQLQIIAWNRRAEVSVFEDEALGLYERNWRYVDQSTLDDKERALISRLVDQYGSGVLLV